MSGLPRQDRNFGLLRSHPDDDIVVGMAHSRPIDAAGRGVFKAWDAGPQFERYIGIDYSGAEVATASLKGLRVYAADRSAPPVEVPPPPSPRKVLVPPRDC